MAVSEYAGKTASIGGGQKTHRIASTSVGGLVWITTACGRQDNLAGEVSEQLPTCKRCLEKEPRRKVERYVCGCCGRLVPGSPTRTVCGGCVEAQRSEVEAERHAQSIEPLPAPFEQGWWRSVVHQAGPRPTRVQVDGPPCSHCCDWNPHVSLSRGGSVHRLNLCTTSLTRHANFSCFRRRA